MACTRMLGPWRFLPGRRGAGHRQHGRLRCHGGCQAGSADTATGRSPERLRSSVPGENGLRQSAGGRVPSMALVVSTHRHPVCAARSGKPTAPSLASRHHALIQCWRPVIPTFPCGYSKPVSDCAAVPHRAASIVSRQQSAPSENTEIVVGNCRLATKSNRVHRIVRMATSPIDRQGPQSA